MNPLQEPSARGLSFLFCRSTALSIPFYTRWPRGHSKRHCCRCGPTTGSGDPSSAATRLICLPLHGRKCGLCKKIAKLSAPQTTWRIHLKCPTPPSYCLWRGRSGYEMVWWCPAISITSCLTAVGSFWQGMHIYIYRNYIYIVILWMFTWMSSLRAGMMMHCI